MARLTLDEIRLLWEDLKEADSIMEIEKADTLRGIFFMYEDIIKQDKALNEEMDRLWNEWD